MKKIMRIEDYVKENREVINDLAESEDERIMKEIVDFIYWAIGRGSITNEQRERSDSWLAYLEKKKEQKPESCDCSRDEESYTNGIHHVLMNPETYGLIKQKPAEWRDTDMNEARNNLISVCRDWERGEHTTLLPVAAVHARYFLEHLTEPKPAEWSDGDEGMLNCIITTLCEESHGGREANGKMVTWLETRLKLLRPQPHWKPSEKQMKALKVVARGFPADDPDAIDSLLTDLQKLL